MKSEVSSKVHEAVSYVTSILLIMAVMAITGFNCPLNAQEKKFIYNGIAYEITQWSERGTCSTAEDCCDYSTDYTADGNIVIPEKVFDEDGHEYKVTIIGWYSFRYDSELKSISLPETIEIIDRGAFDFCESLVSFRCPSSLRKIGQGAFWKCTNLKSVEFNDSLDLIGDFAFILCKSLESIEIPGSVRVIGWNAFCLCSSLKSVKFSDGLTELNPAVFTECTSLEKVLFPDSLEWIYGKFYPLSDWDDRGVFEGTFYGCTSLRHLWFPDSLEKIGNLAFEGCTDVETVVLPKNLKTLGYRAFDCPSLRDVIYPVSEPVELIIYDNEDLFPIQHLDGDCFLDVTYETATLKVGMGGLEKARQTSPWKFFKNIVEVDFSRVEAVASEVSSAESDGVYRMDGLRVGDSTDGLPCGLYIVREGGKTSKTMVP